MSGHDGDVMVGEGATVLPHSVLLPGSRVGAGETWGSVPARRIEREEMERLKQHIRGGKSLDLGSYRPNGETALLCDDSFDPLQWWIGAIFVFESFFCGPQMVL